MESFYESFFSFVFYLIDGWGENEKYCVENGKTMFVIALSVLLGSSLNYGLEFCPSKIQDTKKGKSP
jgi:hypothetical protein